MNGEPFIYRLQGIVRLAKRMVQIFIELFIAWIRLEDILDGKSGIHCFGRRGKQPDGNPTKQGRTKDAVFVSLQRIDWLLVNIRFDLTPDRAFGRTGDMMDDLCTHIVCLEHVDRTLQIESHPLEKGARHNGKLCTEVQADERAARMHTAHCSFTEKMGKEQQAICPGGRFFRERG